MMEFYKSISMDAGRIGIVEHPDKVCTVTKKTTLIEILNMTQMSLHLQNTGSFEWQGEQYKITIPKVISWDDATGVLELELKCGKNLEALLSSVDNDRKQTVNFTHNILEWMKNTGTFWHGIAPRHIVINSDQREITLLDFERPVVLRQNGFKDEEFDSLLRGLVHEEFSAFLFENEQPRVFPTIWKSEVSTNDILVNTIHGKRVKLLLENFFGLLGDVIKAEQLHFVYKFMSSIVTPFFVDGKAFYPLKAIDERTREADKYVETVLQLSRMDRLSWPEYLGYEIN